MAEENSRELESGTVPATAPLTQFQIEEVSRTKRKWVATLYPGHLGLQPEGEAQPYIFLRDDFFTKIEFQPGIRLLVLRVPPKVGFKLTKESMDALRQWFGVPNRAQLAALLKRRYTLALPIALLLVVSSLPLGRAQATGLPPMAFDPLNCALGAALFVLWGCSKWRPNPVLFLLDGVWFGVLAAAQALNVWRNHRWWALAFTALLLWAAINGINRYRQFRR